MCRAMLQLILPGVVNKDTCYRKVAANTDRIDAAAAKRYCQNTSDCAVCNKKVVLSDMHDLVQMWTNLSDEAQVNYLALDTLAPSSKSGAMSTVRRATSQEDLEWTARMAEMWDQLWEEHEDSGAHEQQQGDRPQDAMGV